MATTAAAVLAVECIGTEHAERSLQRIGLLGAPALATGAVLRARCRTAAASAETTTAAVAKPAPAHRAARVRDEAFVEGLLQRVRDRCGIEIHVVVVTSVGVAVDHAFVREVLRRRGRAIATRAALAVVGSVILAATLAIVALLLLRMLTAMARFAIAVAVAATVVVAASGAARALVVVVVVTLAARCALAARQAPDRAHVAVLEVDPHAALQAERKHHGAVADANQAAHCEPTSVEQLANFAVAAFGDDNAVPVVRTIAAAVDDRFEARLLAFDIDAFKQARLVRLGQCAEQSHGVFALDAEAWVHQLVRELAGVREQQQAFGVDVEPADRLPFALLQTRQAAEHGRAVLRIVVSDDFADRLVVRDDARRRRHDAQLDRLAFDLHTVAERDALANMRRLAVDLHVAIGNQVFHVAARADARLREHLVQLGRVGVGQQHTLRRSRVVFNGLNFGLGLAVDVELTRQHLCEQLAGFDRCGRRWIRCSAVFACIVIRRIARFTRLAAFTAFAVAAAATAVARTIACVGVRGSGVGVDATHCRCRIDWRDSIGGNVCDGR